VSGSIPIVYHRIVIGSPRATRCRLMRNSSLSSLFLTTSVDQCLYELNINCPHNGHPCRTFHSITVPSCSLNAFLASISKNSRFSSMWCESRMVCVACIAPYIPPCKPPQRMSVLHIIVTSLPATNRTAVAMVHHHISPIPMGLIPGILSSDNSLPAHIAL
jgi:hypothetical protein